MKPTDIIRDTDIDPSVMDAAKGYYTRKLEPADRNPYKLDSIDWQDKETEEPDSETHIEAFKEFEAKMKTLGWKRIGTGYFSYVYQNPKSDFILKVNRVYDSGYARFVLLTKKFSNPHFPRIGNMKYLNVGGKKYYMYLIEPLQEITTNKVKWKTLAYTLQRIISHPDWTLEDVFREIKSIFPEYTPHFNAIRKMLANDPTLMEACKILTNHLSKNELDLHYGNLMLRKDGTVVIIDPFSTPKDRRGAEDPSDYPF